MCPDVTDASSRGHHQSQRTSLVAVTGNRAPNWASYLPYVMGRLPHGPTMCAVYIECVIQLHQTYISCRNAQADQQSTGRSTANCRLSRRRRARLPLARKHGWHAASTSLFSNESHHSNISIHTVNAISLKSVEVQSSGGSSNRNVSMAAINE
jgi:hypothetical protein